MIYMIFFFLIFSWSLVREAVAEMRNKEAAATTTLLDNGEQVLLNLFIIFANIANINIFLCKYCQQPPCSTMENRFSFSSYLQISADCIFSTYLKMSADYIHKYWQTNFKVITTLPIRKEVVWKHGSSFPGTQATIKTPGGLRRFV